MLNDVGTGHVPEERLEPVGTSRLEQAPYPGVYRTSWGNRWFVQTTIAGKRRYLGTYLTPDDAHAAIESFKDRYEST